MRPYWIACIELDESLLYLADRRLLPGEHLDHTEIGYTYTVVFAGAAEVLDCDVCGAQGAMLLCHDFQPTVIYAGDDLAAAWLHWLANADQLLEHTRLTTSGAPP